MSKVILPALYYAPTPNQSGRNGQRIRGIVVHETQGAFLGAVSWLRNPSVRASAHGVLSEDGAKFAQLVPWRRKAWHAENANAYTLGLELAGTEAGANDPRQLARAARICAFWGQEFNIPVKQGNAHGEGGIVRHQDLGEFGGGHHDPGGFDWERFLALCKAEAKRGGFRPSWGIYS